MNHYNPETKQVELPITGWPTPIASTNLETHEAAMKELERAKTSAGGCTKLSVMAHSPIAGWPTPTTGDTKGVFHGRYDQEGKQDTNRSQRLSDFVQTTEPPITGWRSPATSEPGVSLDRLVDSEGNPWTPGQRAYDKITGRLAQVGLTHEAQAAIPLTGWPTPNARDWKDGAAPSVTNGERTDKLAHAVHSPIAGFPTPCAGDKKWMCSQYSTAKKRADSGKQVYLEAMLHLNLSPVETAKPAGLAPALPRWLMGYPVEWCQAAIRAHRAMPTKRRKQG
jgi:hypothetical protein